MLNLQFAETMELTEAELQDVRGGNITSVCVGENIGCGGSALPAWGEVEVLVLDLMEHLIGRVG